MNPTLNAETRLVLCPVKQNKHFYFYEKLKCFAKIGHNFCFYFEITFCASIQVLCEFLLISKPEDTVVILTPLYKAQGTTTRIFP